MLMQFFFGGGGGGGGGQTMCIMRDVQVTNDAISLRTDGAWLLGGHFRFLLPRNFRLPIRLSQWRNSM